MSEKCALVVMAKRPAAGKTKTRLSPPLSLENSAELYDNFLQDLIPKLQALSDISVLIAYPMGDSAETYFHQLAPDLQKIVQAGDTLGDRLANVIDHCFQAGFTRVAAVNSDSPTLPHNYYTDGFTQLNDPQTDAIFGPCEDGGYYLIGLKSPHPSLLRNIEMSTPNVLRDSLAEAARLDLTVALLPSWYDVDDTQSLARLGNELDQHPMKAPATYRFLHKLR